MVEYTLSGEQLIELRVRQTMIEREKDMVAMISFTLQHESDIVRQLEEMVAHLEQNNLHIQYRKEYQDRRRLLRKQRGYVQEVIDKRNFYARRFEALHEAMIFYLVKHFQIDPSLPWKLDIEGERLISGEIERLS